MLTRKGKQQGHCFKGSDPSSPCVKISVNSNMATKYTTHELQNMKLLISCSRDVSRYHLYNENRETIEWKMFEVATDSTSSTLVVFSGYQFMD